MPFPPGGFNDIVGRLIAAQLSERLGKQFIVENRPGAGGIIAGELVANAPKDGHTLMIVSLAITVNPHFYKMPYDPVKAYAPVAILATAPNVVSVNTTCRRNRSRNCWRSPRPSRANCDTPPPASARSCISAPSCSS